MDARPSLDTIEDQLEMYDAAAHAALRNIIEQIEVEARTIIDAGRARLVEGHTRHGAALFSDDSESLVQMVRKNIGDAVVVEAARMNQAL